MSIKDKLKKNFVISQLRRASFRWEGRWKSEKRSKLKARGEYFCEECGLVCKKKDTQMDHTIPVVDPIMGFTNFDDYIDRLFCSEEGFKRLCKPCHEEKTEKENIVRRES